MRSVFLLFALFVSRLLFAQPDTVRMREPNLQTSFEKYELLILAVVGLLLLMGIRFWFRRTRRR